MKKPIQRWFSCVVILMVNFHIFADSTPGLKQSKPSSKAILTDPLTVVFGLLFVLASIVAMVWLMKRMGTMGGIRNSQLKIVAALNLGSREKLVVIQVGEKQLLIGVTPSSINTLHTLEIPLELDSAPELFSNALAERLKHVIKRKGGQ